MSNLPPIPKGSPIEGSITKCMDQRFLSSIDFIGQGTVNLVVERVEFLEKIKYENGQSKEKVILCYFKKCNRPLALNKTNIKAIISLTGTSRCSDWLDHTIPLYAAEGNYFGKKGYAVRVNLSSKVKIKPAVTKELKEGIAEDKKAALDLVVKDIGEEDVNFYLLDHEIISEGETWQDLHPDHIDGIVRDRDTFKNNVQAFIDAMNSLGGKE